MRKKKKKKDKDNLQVLKQERKVLLVFKSVHITSFHTVFSEQYIVVFFSREYTSLVNQMIQKRRIW